MTVNELALLSFIKQSFSSEPQVSIVLPEGCSLSAVYQIAVRQGLSAVVFDALERLPAAHLPAQPLLLQWIGKTAQMEHLYDKHVGAITSLADFYSHNGIKMLLLKGYGCSLSWPQPVHRPVGDVDVYLFGKHDYADNLVEQQLGIDVHREYHKHSTFTFHGVEVENHAKFIDDISHRSNIRFERILMSLLTEEDCIHSPICNVLLPPPTFNALFLLRHAGEHFASNEMTLRQILDVGTFFQEYHQKLNWPLVFDVYRKEGMMAYFNAIATICVEYLGFDSNCFVSIDKHYSYEENLTLAERVLEDIFADKDTLPMSTVSLDTVQKKLKYSFAKTLRWWRNRWKYRLVYNESLAESFVWLAKNRLKSMV